jgi:sensor histidine kinase YesM
VATDAGIARFDGKYFQIFTTKQGLPDNEVISVLKENNGTIWVNCFKQHPAYFDEVKNRFINATEDSSLQKIKGTQIMYGYPLQNGGVIFYSEYGSFIAKDKKVKVFATYEKEYTFLINENKNDIQFKWALHRVDPILKKYVSKIIAIKKNNIIDSIQFSKIYTFKNNTIVPAINKDKLYLFHPFDKKCFVYSNLKTSLSDVKIDSVIIPDNYNGFDIAQSSVNFYSNSGKIYEYNKNTLKQQLVMSGNYTPNSMYNDGKGNVWVCTIDKGLILYRQNSITSITLPDDFKNKNFLSIACKQNGLLLAGNYNGEIIETDGGKFIIHTSLKNGEILLRQRKIIISQKKVFSFSESGIFINYTKQITSEKLGRIYAKNAITYNDSIIIFTNNSRFYKLNTITENISVLHDIDKRITTLVKEKDGSIDYGSVDGLYKYNYIKDTTFSLLQNNPLCKERITGLSVSEDNILWMATSSNGIVAIKDNKVLLHLTEKQGIINSSVRSVISAKSGQVWCGTVAGISKINYQIQENKINYSIQNLTVNDGLSSNVFNEILFQNDTIYAATANGISVIPSNISVSKFSIPIQLISVTINQQDTNIATNYNLNYNQQNIELQFAGIELGGHFKSLQYTINNNSDWITLTENVLSLQLSNGKHLIQVRAIDVNGNISDKILTIAFKIATPFYKALWFWLLCFTSVFGIAFYFIQKRNKQNQQQKLDALENKQRLAQIEMQAIKAQINPHFIFNCLNSIKSLNYQQRYAEADSYTDKFSTLLRNVLDFSSHQTISLEQELNYIKNYIELEQLRFGEKLQFELTIDSIINQKNIQIPALLLQPYIENAIRHGIGNLVNEKGILKLNIAQQVNFLIVLIDDNGVGREKAMLINTKKIDYHQSKGTELSNRRLELYNIECLVIDKKNEDEMSIGTCVQLKILI